MVAGNLSPRHFAAHKEAIDLEWQHEAEPPTEDQSYSLVQAEALHNADEPKVEGSVVDESGLVVPNPEAKEPAAVGARPTRMQEAMRRMEADLQAAKQEAQQARAESKQHQQAALEAQKSARESQAAAASLTSQVSWASV